MDAPVLALLGLGWWGFGTSIHWLSAALARRPAGRIEPHHAVSDFSIVAPMAGAGDATPPYVSGLRILAEQGAEVLICVADEQDSAVPAVRAVWPQARILVGADDTFNPKMNNVRKGLEAASRNVVALCDAGIVLTREELRCAAASLGGKVGLVLALKVAEEPGNFPAEIERAYIDGHQARFLLAADRLGLAVASGGVTLIGHDTLQAIGNWRGFNRWIADDYSVVRSVRELGLRTQLGSIMPRLPLGERNWSTVWRRQVRWARTRLRLPVWPLVLWEPLIGGLATGAAGVAALAGLGGSAHLLGMAAMLHLASWLAAEKWFMGSHGLAFGAKAAAAAIVREALAPVLILAALRSRTIYWRGVDLGGQWRDSSRDTESKGSV